MHHQPEAESVSYAKKVNKKTPNTKNSLWHYHTFLALYNIRSSHLPDFMLTRAAHPFQALSLEALSCFISFQLNRSVPPV
jgi:hypothetical protein